MHLCSQPGIKKWTITTFTLLVTSSHYLPRMGAILISNSIDGSVPVFELHLLGTTQQVLFPIWFLLLSNTSLTATLKIMLGSTAPDLKNAGIL